MYRSMYRTGIIFLCFMFMPAVSSSEANLQKATFAGGCFWCMEHPFEDLEGVQDVVSGYTGGQKENPTYEEISSGTTGHREAVQVVFDPTVVPYRRLLDVFLRQINPTDPNGQFVDRGFQYSTAIYYHNDDQKKQAEQSRDEIQKSGRYEKPVVTEILPISEFYAAEEYHQDFAKKNSVRYKLYRFYSGRDQYLKKIWKKE